MPSLNRLSGPTEEYLLPPCATVDPNIFLAHRKILAAKRICMTCPVRKECLHRAMERKERVGVYGGLSATDRIDLAARLACRQADDDAVGN